MPSAGLIRQKLLAVIEDVLLPGIRTSGAGHVVFAAAPSALPGSALPAFHADGHIAVRPLKLPPKLDRSSVFSYPAGRVWEAAGLHSIRFPILQCVVEGALHTRVGVVRARQNGKPSSHNLKAAYAFSLQSPAHLIVPPHTPHSSGGFLPWEQDADARREHSCATFTLRVLPTGVLCHQVSIRKGARRAQYPLLIEDAFLAPMMELLLNEYRAPEGRPEIVQCQLMTLLLRVQKALQSSHVTMTNNMSSRFPASPDVVKESNRQVALMEKAANFIQLHLHEPLSPAVIGRHVRLKPTQLNFLFRGQSQLSVMQYVAQKRIETACLLLQTSELSIREIGQLAGFKHTSHFSRAFHARTGASPLKFRQQQASSYRADNKTSSKPHALQAGSTPSLSKNNSPEVKKPVAQLKTLEAK